MNETAAFDVLAVEYDKEFTGSLVGAAQRDLSRHWLMNFLADKNNLEILEINCGTGEDAFWLSSLGHQVVATDQSQAMITEALKKITDQKKDIPEFSVCDFQQLHEKFSGRKFDLIFSNFAGLNCVSPKDMPGLSKQLSSLLKENGHLAIVVFGKHTWWEVFYYLLKGSPARAFRRWQKKPVRVQLKEQVEQTVYYYSAKEVQRLFHPFTLVEQRPVGLFIPPSYMEHNLRNHPGIFQALQKMERLIKKTGRGSSFSDHSFLLLKKQQP